MPTAHRLPPTAPQLRQQRRGLVAAEARGFEGAVQKQLGLLLQVKQSLPLVFQPRQFSVPIFKVLLRRRLENGHEAFHRVTGGAQGGGAVTVVALQGQGRGEKAQAILEARLERPSGATGKCLSRHLKSLSQNPRASRWERRAVPRKEGEMSLALLRDSSLTQRDAARRPSPEGRRQAGAPRRQGPWTMDRIALRALPCGASRLMSSRHTRILGQAL